MTYFHHLMVIVIKLCQRTLCNILGSNVCILSLSLSIPLSLSLSFQCTTTRGGPRPPSRVSSILPGLCRLLSSFYTLPLLQIPSLHLPSTAWVSLWGAFLLAHWGSLSWLDHHRPGIWHALSISVYSACRISQCHSHCTADRVGYCRTWWFWTAPSHFWYSAMMVIHNSRS
jgi:hypothetical protein